MGKRICPQKFETSHVPFANEKPFTLSVTARHNHKHMEETSPKIKPPCRIADERRRMKNYESEEHMEGSNRPPSKKNLSDPFNKGVIPPIKGKKHIQESEIVGTSSAGQKRPIRALPGGFSTAGGFMDQPL